MKRTPFIYVFALLLALSAFSGSWREVGQASYTNCTAVQGLGDAPASGVALPDDATGAMIQAKSGAIRYTFGSTEPASDGAGILLAADAVLAIEPGNRRLLEGFRFIEDDAGTPAALDILYLKD